MFVTEAVMNILSVNPMNTMISQLETELCFVEYLFFRLVFIMQFNLRV